jgi:hypothetical protein
VCRSRVLTIFVWLLAATKWSWVDLDEPTMGAEAGKSVWKIKLEYCTMIILSRGTWTVNVMPCHEDRDYVNDDEIVPTKAR